MTGAAKKIDRNRHHGPRAASVTVSTRAVAPLLAYVSARGHDKSAFLRDRGVDPEIFSDPEARLLHVTAAALWPAASQLTKDSDLGLHVAEGVRPGSYGVLGLALRTSENLGAALERLCRYHRFLHDVAEVKLTLSGDRVTLSHRLPITAALPRAIAEYVVAAWLVTARQATGVNWTPLEARFPHAAPDDTSEYQRVFACPLKFGHTHSELLFARRFLDLPLLEADSDTQAILEAHVVSVLERLPHADATTDAVRRHLAGAICKGQPAIEEIAPRLHMSARTALDRSGTAELPSFNEDSPETRAVIARGSRNLLTLQTS